MKARLCGGKKNEIYVVSRILNKIVDEQKLIRSSNLKSHIPLL